MTNPAIPDRYGPADLYPEFNFANEINPQPLQWLWPDRIPLAKLTLLIGDPGVGKPLLATDLAARVSTGAPWPDSPSLETRQALRTPSPIRNPQSAIRNSPTPTVDEAWLWSLQRPDNEGAT